MSKYQIFPLPNGKCRIPGQFAFHGGDPSTSVPYSLYYWLVLGAEKPILVDTGLDNVDEMNQGAAHVMAEPISQSADERAELQLRRFGLTETDIGAVVITHLHFDHVDRLDKFTNAKVFVSGSGFAAATANNWHGSWAPGKTLELLTKTAPERTVAEDNAEVAPGMRTMWMGGHSKCSQALLVPTSEGTACITGDTVSLLKNIEDDVAVGVYQDVDQCYHAMQLVRDNADIVLASHDPLMWERYGQGLGKL